MRVEKISQPLEKLVFEDLYKLSLASLHRLDDFNQPLAPHKLRNCPLAKFIRIMIVIKERERSARKAKTKTEQKEHLQVANRYKKYYPQFTY